jgi:hypothetical protein
LIVADVDLELFPVCHHSPAAAVHMVQRLRNGPPPKVIFLELCEDLQPVLEKLRDCRLPVALQAFASGSETFPKGWTPLSVVAPLTEFSAEYQAIAYCMTHPGTEMVFVDRSVDHIFQWMPQNDAELEKHLPDDEAEPDDAPAEQGEGDEEEEPAKQPAHGAAVGVQVGRLEPTFGLFREFLLKNARVKYFAEWWDRYVEQPLLSSDYAAFRQVMCLIGSLLRRLGRRDEDHESDRLRERFMWTRMKDYLAKHRVDPRDALHICGAFHAASDVEEFGTRNAKRWDIPPRTNTPWLYGLLPSSHRAIEWQFSFPPGTVTLCEAHWQKSQRALNLKSFVVKKTGSSSSVREQPVKRPPSEPAAPADLMAYLTKPRLLADEDHEQLLQWCVGIVNLARRNGYLGSTADAIAVYHSAVLLAQLRNRSTPTPYDFRDAAVTCLEKDRTPKKRDIPKLCDMLLGGDRIGQVGKDSLPALAQNVYDRLAPLKLNLTATNVQRALLDLRAQPDLLPCSDLLWKLFYLLGPSTVRPIVGEKALGHVPIQESWEIFIGRNQTPIITLGYEGVTVEQVLEKRLRAKAFEPEAGTVAALAAAEECLLFLGSPRLTEEIGAHAVQLLTRETGAQTAPEIFDRCRHLIHYFRSTPVGLPPWVESFVTTGYSHYTTLLPRAFADNGTTPEQVAASLAFVFTLESLALSLGCKRSQLAIAIRQSATLTQDPRKLGLLWTAEWLLGARTIDSIRQFFDEVLDNALAVASMPAYLNGHLLALKFTPLAGPLVVELVSKAFERLPSHLLMPWLPGLIMMLRQHGGEVLPPLIKEASRALPETIAQLAAWIPPWEKPAATLATPAEQIPQPTGEEGAVHRLLRTHPATADAMSRLLGREPVWVVDHRPAPAESRPSVDSPKEADLLRRCPESARALGELLAR